MDGSTFDKIVAQARARQDEILEAKGADYTASSGERLFNFNFISLVTGVPRRQVWAVYFMKHVLAVMNFCKGGTESEPIAGRLDDVVNYVYLLEGIVEDEKAFLQNLSHSDSAPAAKGKRS